MTTPAPTTDMLAPATAALRNRVIVTLAGRTGRDRGAACWNLEGEVLRLAGSGTLATADLLAMTSLAQWLAGERREAYRAAR